MQVGSTCRDGLIGASNVDIQNVHRMIYCFTSCNIATVLSLKVTACLMRSASYNLRILAQSEVEGKRVSPRKFAQT